MHRKRGRQGLVPGTFVAGVPSAGAGQMVELAHVKLIRPHPSEEYRVIRHVHRQHKLISLRHRPDGISSSHRAIDVRAAGNAFVIINARW